MRTDPQSEIIQRLHCAAGHLDAVIEMAEAGKPCEELLHQLNAVQAALRVTGRKLLVCQAQNSQTIILDNPSAERRISELKRLQALYTTFTQFSNSPNEVNYE
jgi:DNA-binding FrmR family transcriptional regulator